MKHTHWHRKGYRYVVFDGGDRLYAHSLSEARGVLRKSSGTVVWRIGRDGKLTKVGAQRGGKRRRNPHRTDKQRLRDEIRSRHRVQPIPEGYGPLAGMEGPFNFPGGVYYYDPREGRYYDRGSDMYLDRDTDPRHPRRNPANWSQMFRRLVSILSYGMPFDEAVESVAASTPGVTRQEVYYAAIAAQSHLEKEGVLQRNPALCDPGPLIQGRSKAGPKSDVVLPDQEQVSTTWEIVPLKSLIYSNDWRSGGTNRDYPQEYQPRDRSLPAYRDQHLQLVKHFDPALLMWSATAQQGSPIIAKHGKKSVVASGNGRTMALAEIYLLSKHAAKAKRYRDEVKRWADLLGVNFPKVISHPVLIRVLPSKIDGPSFARAANVSVIAQYNATEQAIADAKEMTPQIMRLYHAFNHKGNIMGLHAKGNRAFLAAFIEHVSGPNTENEILAKDGKPSEEGKTRIQNAMFRYAYGPSVDKLIYQLAERPTKGVSAMLTGMTAAAPAFIDLQIAIDEGGVPPEYDLRSSLVGGVFLAIHARQENEKPLEAAWQPVLQERGVRGYPLEAYWTRCLYLAVPNRIAGDPLASVAATYVSNVLDDALGEVVVGEDEETMTRSGRTTKAFKQAQGGLFGDMFGTAATTRGRLSQPPATMLAAAIAESLFNEPYALRAAEGRRKMVREVKQPKPDEVAAAVGSLFLPIAERISQEWKEWAIEWHNDNFAAAKGSFGKKFDAAYKAAMYFFPAGTEADWWGAYKKTGRLSRLAPVKPK